MSNRVSKVFDATRQFSPCFVPARNTALLLLDYQILTVSMLGEAGIQCVRKARDLQSWAQKHGMPILHCVVDISQEPNPPSRINERWSNYQKMIEQKPGIGNEVQELESFSSNDQTFTRRPGHVSALSSPGILEVLRTKNISSLILCGLSTSGCVLSTVRTATEHDYIVTIAEDACADPVPELHDMLVKHVLPTTSHVATSDEIKNLWSSSSQDG